MNTQSVSLVNHITLPRIRNRSATGRCRTVPTCKQRCMAVGNTTRRSALAGLAALLCISEPARAEQEQEMLQVFSPAELETVVLRNRLAGAVIMALTLPIGGAAVFDCVVDHALEYRKNHSQ